MARQSIADRAQTPRVRGRCLAMAHQAQCYQIVVASSNQPWLASLTRADERVFRGGEPTTLRSPIDPQNPPPAPPEEGSPDFADPLLGGVGGGFYPSRFMGRGSRRDGGPYNNYRVAFVPKRVVSSYVSFCFSRGFSGRTNFTLFTSTFSNFASVLMSQSPAKLRRMSHTMSMSLEICNSSSHLSLIVQPLTLPSLSERRSVFCQFINFCFT